MMMSVDVTNRNGPTATPPTSLSLRSSHNQLLSTDVINQGADTPPKCRKKYALTSIQAAMGLGDAVPSPSSPTSSSPSQSSTPNNPKLAKNGVNQLRKAGQDHNKNTTDPDSTDVECNSETITEDIIVNTTEETDGHTLCSNDPEDDVFNPVVELHPDANSDAEPEQKSESDIDCNINTIVELKLNGNSTDFDLNLDAEQSDDISILSEREIMSMMKTGEGGDEVMVEDQEDEENKPLLMIKSESPVKSLKVSSGLELISDLHSNLKILTAGKDSPAPPPPFPRKQASPEDTPLLSVASCSSSSSSSPETKKDRRTGAKTDCALNRIQNLNPSDEELSWTTLSQESNSPEETGTHIKHTSGHILKLTSQLLPFSDVLHWFSCECVSATLVICL